MNNQQTEGVYQSQHRKPNNVLVFLNPSINHEHPECPLRRCSRCSEGSNCPVQMLHGDVAPSRYLNATPAVCLNSANTSGLPDNSGNPNKHRIQRLSPDDYRAMKEVSDLTEPSCDKCKLFFLESIFPSLRVVPHRALILRKRKLSWTTAIYGSHVWTPIQRHGCCTKG